MVETWKLLAGGAVVALTFGIVASVLNVALTPPVVVGLLLFAVVVVAINYVLFRRSYRAGQRLGGNEEE